MLDLVFCPAYTTLSMLGWFVRARTRNHLRSPKVVAARAKEIIIESERPAHYQLDGEAPIDHADDPDLGPPNTPLHATIGHATLPVMRVAAPQNAHASARHRPAGTQRHSTQHAHQPEAAPQTMPAPQRP
jgi:hypothetical protein